MALFQIVRHHQDRLRLRGDRRQIGRKRLRAKGGGRGLGDRAVHRPRAEIDVRRADDLAGDALHQEVLFVGRQRRTEERDRICAMLLPNLGKPLDAELDCLFPGRWLQFAITTKQVLSQPLALLDRVVVEAAAHADLVVAERVEQIRLDDHGFPVPMPHADRAADAAGVTDRRHPILGAGEPLVRLLHQRRSRTDVDAGAAEIAVRFIDRAARAEGDASREAAAGQRDSAGVP